MSIVDNIRARLFGSGETGPPVGESSDGDDPAAGEPVVVMYSTRFCPFCMRARALLQRKGVRYRDIAVDGKPELRREMAEKSGRNTVPQIWIGATHVGGCDELLQLERQGELDAMLVIPEG